MFGLIPISIVVGIIEDEIANVLSSDDTKTRKHLKKLKKKIKGFGVEKDTTIYLTMINGKILRYPHNNLNFQNGFLMLDNDGTTEFVNVKEVFKIKVVAEEWYLINRTKGKLAF